MAQPPASGAPHGETPDPSMDDILASIRRILNDEEKTAAAPPPEGVLMLDPSMMVENQRPEPPPPAAAPPPSTVREPEMTPATPDREPALEPAAERLVAPEPDAERLVAPEAAAAAATSVGTLMRTLVAERQAVVHRGGPSIEDLVREEIRPVLKAWLDTHLPPLVERLVRAEIERVVGRIGG